MATLEENTDVIVGIFKHYGLDPKKHNIFPVEEETEQNAATEAAGERGRVPAEPNCRGDFP